MASYGGEEGTNEVQNLTIRVSQVVMPRMMVTSWMAVMVEV